MDTGKLGILADLTLAVGATISEFSTDGTLGGNSVTVVPTESAVKTYADTKEPALGFTPENVANKDTDITLAANSDTKYPSQRAIKSYVDSLALGLDWRESVLGRIDFTTAEPAAPSTGDRYINTVTGTSNETSQSVTIDGIYEWNGSTWTESLPNEGFASWVENEDVLYVYNGAAWVKFGSTVTHANLAGLQGGSGSEFYHLTSSEHVELTGWLDNVTLASNGDLTLVSGTNINEFSTDGTLAGDSDDAVPTEKAVKTYVDANAGGGLTLISTTVMTLSQNSGNIAITAGKRYRVYVTLLANADDDATVSIRFDSDSGVSDYAWYRDTKLMTTSPTSTLVGDDADSAIQLGLLKALNTFTIIMDFDATASAAGDINIQMNCIGKNGSGADIAVRVDAIYKDAGTLTDFEIIVTGASVTGTIKTYEYE